jgi:hypothetical protein
MTPREQGAFIDPMFRRPRSNAGRIVVRLGSGLTFPVLRRALLEVPTPRLRDLVAVMIDEIDVRDGDSDFEDETIEDDEG